jgi:hypothetical protein
VSLSVPSVSSRENDDGRAEIHLNPANPVNPVKKSVALEFSYMVENAVHENSCSNPNPIRTT